MVNVEVKVYLVWFKRRQIEIYFILVDKIYCLIWKRLSFALPITIPFRDTPEKRFINSTYIFVIIHFDEKKGSKSFAAIIR